MYASWMMFVIYVKKAFFIWETSAIEYVHSFNIQMQLMDNVMIVLAKIVHIAHLQNVYIVRMAMNLKMDFALRIVKIIVQMIVLKIV
jgi:hypothetical protein